MRKITVLTFMIFQAMLLHAQSLTITGSNSIMYNSITTLGLDTLDPCLQTHSYLTIKNTSNKEHDILCEKNVISESSGAANYFCWGGNCYPAGATISSSHLTLLSGQADNVSFGGYFDAYCDNDAQAIVEYCFFPDVDPLDRSCIYITYHAAATLISETNPLIITDFYPNPAKETVNFNYYLNEPANLIVMDILGNQVKTIKLFNKTNQKMNISDLSKGIYFGNVIVNNEVITIKKLIVE